MKVFLDVNVFSGIFYFSECGTIAIVNHLFAHFDNILFGVNFMEDHKKVF